MAGPLPKPDAERRRRNTPTIPTTNLPAAGRSGPAPEVPSWMDLGVRALAYWAWAWTLPQAAGWSEGDRPMVARRAMLEDLLVAADKPESFLREMRDLDDRLGLSPKGLAALRWRIMEEAEKPAAGLVVVEPGRWQRGA